MWACGAVVSVLCITNESLFSRLFHCFPVWRTGYSQWSQVFFWLSLVIFLKGERCLWCGYSLYIQRCSLLEERAAEIPAGRSENTKAWQNERRESFIKHTTAVSKQIKKGKGQLLSQTSLCYTIPVDVTSWWRDRYQRVSKSTCVRLRTCVLLWRRLMCLLSNFTVWTVAISWSVCQPRLQFPLCVRQNVNVSKQILIQIYHWELLSIIR